jgi:hypothetical protein
MEKDFLARREAYQMLLISPDTNGRDARQSNATLERRRGLRIRQHRPIKVFEPALSRYFGGQTEDISATGLRIEVPMSAPIREGKLVNIYVGLNAAGQTLANRRHMIAARVIWIDRRSSANRIIAGIEYLASAAAHVDAA